MARKNEYGRYILSAGEIGAFTVCPESWRLRSVQKAKAIFDQRKNDGKALHKTWAKDYEDAVYLSYGARVALGLILLVVLVKLLY